MDLPLISPKMYNRDISDSMQEAVLLEAFAQGDQEKGLGLSSMAMMDREKAYIPEIEFRFLSGIALPVFV